MEQRGFVESALGQIFQHQRAGGERDRNFGAFKRAGRQRPRPGSPRPDRRQMTFARALRTAQQHRARRPIRPALDQPQRRSVGWAGEKILAREAFGVIEGERELRRLCRPAVDMGPARHGQRGRCRPV